MNALKPKFWLNGASDNDFRGFESPKNVIKVKNIWIFLKRLPTSGVCK